MQWTVPSNEECAFRSFVRELDTTSDGDEASKAARILQARRGHKRRNG